MEMSISFLLCQWAIKWHIIVHQAIQLPTGFYSLKYLTGIFSTSKQDWRVMTRLYRGPLLIIEFLFLWGINIYGWRSSGVNHVLIFEMDPRNHLSEQHIIEMAAIFGIMWSLSVQFPWKQQRRRLDRVCFRCCVFCSANNWAWRRLYIRWHWSCWCCCSCWIPPKRFGTKLDFGLYECWFVPRRMRDLLFLLTHTV